MTRSNIGARAGCGPTHGPANKPWRPASPLAIVTALLAILLIPASPAADPAASQGPRIEVEAGSFDFGQLNRGETAVARFTLRNVGSEPLRILNVKPG